MTGDHDRSPADGPGPVCIAGHRIVVRAIAVEDLERERAFVRALSPRSAYKRFFEPSGSCRTPWRSVSFRSMGSGPWLVAVDERADRFVGVARYVGDAQGNRCEFAVTIADDWQRCRLGRMLMGHLVRHARGRG